MARIDNAFIRNEFQIDNMSDVNWAEIKSARDAADRILANPAKFPKANFEYLENKAMECSLFLLQGPVQYI